MIPSSVTDKVVARDGDHCRYCGDLVLPTAMPTPIGLTFDLVDPAGPMTVENIVVACRRCNTRKAARTLAAAGMTLRPPIPSGVTRSASAAPRARSAGTLRPSTVDLIARLRQAFTAALDVPGYRSGDAERALLPVVIAALAAAGFDDLDTTELRLLGWLCGWEPDTVGTLVGLMIAGRS